MIGDSTLILSIMGWNTTKRVSADVAATQKITKVEWRTSIELVSFDASQFDISNSKKIWIKRETKKSFSQLINSVYPSRVLIQIWPWNG